MDLAATNTNYERIKIIKSIRFNNNVFESLIMKTQRYFLMSVQGEFLLFKAENRG